MSPPPTSIDGTDITGATIDGQEVQEITIDGQTVFTATQLPVAYGNLLQWYPFDSSEYGGNNADDVTAILGGSGDDTAFNGTVNGATYNSTDGVTDINKGQNSGAFIFNLGDFIEVNSRAFGNEFTICAFIKPDTPNNGTMYSARDADGSTPKVILKIREDRQLEFFNQDQSGNAARALAGSYPDNSYTHIAGVRDTTSTRLFVNGSQIDADTTSLGNFPKPNQRATIGVGRTIDVFGEFDGSIDDLRVYNKALSSSEVSQIVSNTQT
jgi:hypothetical protein